MLTVLLSILVLFAFAGTFWFFYRQTAGAAGRVLEEAGAKATAQVENARRHIEEVQLKARDEAEIGRASCRERV